MGATGEFLARDGMSQGVYYDKGYLNHLSKQVVKSIPLADHKAMVKSLSLYAIAAVPASSRLKGLSLQRNLQTPSGSDKLILAPTAQPELIDC